MKSSLPNKKLLALLFTGVLMGALDIAIIGPALPAIRNEFNVSMRDASWVFNIYLLLHLISSPVMAKLSDTYGRRKIYIIDVLIFALGSLIIVVSPDFNILLLGRAIQGFGAGGIFPVASAVIGDSYPKEKQGIALGLIGTVFGLAFILGPIIGGVLLMFDWRWIFAVNLPIAAGIVIFALILIPKENYPKARKFDISGLILITLILACFSYSINIIDANRFFDSLLSLDVLPFFLISIVLIPAFWNVELRAENPIIEPNLFRNKQLVLAYIIGFGAGMCEAAAMYAPALAKQNFNVSDSDASFMLLPMVFAMFVAAPLSGYLIDKKGSGFTIVFGTSLTTLALIVLTLFSDTISGFYTGGSFLGIGLAFLLGAPLRHIINSETGKENRAVGQGVVTLSTSTGQILSAALLGGVIASFSASANGFKLALALLVVIGIILIIASINLKKK
jgi:EmrB/QacA subfamily drug resistance transporter